MMGYTIMKIKQSFCWHCGKKLDRRSYTKIADPIGNIHIIHKFCEQDAKLEMRAMPYEEEQQDFKRYQSATCNFNADKC